MPRMNGMLLLGVAALLRVSIAEAQCEPRWLEGAGVPGANDMIAAMATWDPDGAGPREPVLVAAGSFTAIGDVEVNRIAMYDRATGEWSPLGLGTNGRINALAVTPSGEVVAAGSFTTAGGGPARNIARWDGTAWSALGAGVDGPDPDPYELPGVYALAVMPNGDVIAGGFLDEAGGVAVKNIARWDGTAWSALGAGVEGTVPYSAVFALAVMPDGGLVAGGYFNKAGGIPAKSIARWNGSAWSAMGGGFGTVSWSIVHVMTILPNGSLAAAGSAGPLQAWDGSTWSLIGGGGFGLYDTFALGVAPNGDLVAGGQYQHPEYFSILQRWDGTAWSSVGTGIMAGFSVKAVACGPGDEVFAGGYFPAAGFAPADVVRATNIARWNGTAWSALADGTEGEMNAVAAGSGDDFYIGGRFERLAGEPIRHLARWDGQAWSQLVDGIDQADGVWTMLSLANGDLLIGGGISVAGGPVMKLARWDGETLSDAGAGLAPFSSVRALAVAAGGDVIVGGPGPVAVQRWNEVSGWAPVGSGLYGDVYAVAAMPNGDIYAGGSFYFNSGDTALHAIARWDGSAWSEVGGGLTKFGDPIVIALTAAPNGDVVAAGTFTSAGGVFARNIARWNGSAWSGLAGGLGTDASSGSVSALKFMPDGSLIATGRFQDASGVPARNIARWDGAAWSPLGAGLGMGGASIVEYGTGLDVTPSGELVAVGSFPVAGGVASANVARWACAACKADLDRDGVVDFTDYLAFLNLFEAQDPAADLDGDGVVDFTDYLEFLNHFDAGC